MKERESLAARAALVVVFGVAMMLTTARPGIALILMGAGLASMVWFIWRLP